MSTVNAFTGSVPANYEKYLGPILFEPYALDLMQRFPKSASNIFELACGTGRVTNHLTKVMHEDATLIASDLNPDMLDIAKSIVEDNRVQWHVVDAMQLPFNEEVFDVVLCQFGVMFFPDKGAAFKGVHRILKNGGTFLFNTWDSFTSNPRPAIMVQVMKDLLGEKTPDFMAKGPYSFFDTDLIHSLLTDAGFTNIKIDTVPKVSYYSDPADIVKGFVEGSPLGHYLNQLGGDMQEEVSKRLHTALKEQYGEKDCSVPMQAFVVEAKK